MIRDSKTKRFVLQTFDTICRGVRADALLLFINTKNKERKAFNRRGRREDLLTAEAQKDENLLS